MLFKLYKGLNEDLSSKLVKAEETFKDTKANPLYFHKTHYGSKEYEDYMITLFDVGFLPTGPNLILSINREHIKKAIEEKIEKLEQD